MASLSKFKVIPYVGLAANGNLGDEYLYSLSRQYVSKAVSITGARHMVKDLLRTSAKRKFLVGGGSLLFSDYLLKSMQRWLSLGLEPFFFGTGSRELDIPSEHALLWGHLLEKHGKSLWVRGEITKNRLKELGISAQVSGDPGFMLNLEFAEPNTRHDYVLVSARLVTHGKLSADDAKSIVGLEIILDELQKRNIKMVFFSAAKEDEGINAYLANKYKSVITHYTQNWKDLISKSRMMITSRMHPGIFALSVAKPVVFIDTRSKYEDSLSYYRGKSALVSDFSMQDLQKVLEFYEETEDDSQTRFHDVKRLAEKQKLIFSHLLD